MAQDGALLSLANWSGVPAAERAERHGSGDSHGGRRDRRPSPLLAALERPAVHAARDTAGAGPSPSLFELLRTRGPRRTAVAAEPENVVATDAPPPRATRRAYLLVPLLALAGAAAGYMSNGAPHYAARAELLLRPVAARVIDGAPNTGDASVPASAVAHSMARATSPQVLGAVVDRLSLATNPDFATGDRERAVSSLAGRISVAPQRLNAGYTLTATAGTPALSGDIANAVADALTDTHEADAAGPPPTSLEVAFRAMPGTAGIEQSPLIGAGIGAGAGAMLGLFLAFAARRRRHAPKAAEKEAAATEPQRTAAITPTMRPQAAHVTVSELARRAPANVTPNPLPTTPRVTARQSAAATPDVTIRSLARAGKGPDLAAKRPQPREALRRTPNARAEAGPPSPVPAPRPVQPAKETVHAMHAPQQVFASTAPVPPAVPHMTAPQPAAWWPQPVAYAPAMPVQQYAQPPMMMVVAQHQPVMMMAPYAQPMPQPMPMQPYPAPAPMQYPQPAAAVPQPATTADEAHDPQTLAAIDEVRAQLRAFAGSLEALRHARAI